MSYLSCEPLPGVRRGRAIRLDAPTAGSSRTGADAGLRPGAPTLTHDPGDK